MRNFAKWNAGQVSLKSSDELSDADAACVESVSQTTSKDGGSISCKLYSKPKALELLMRHYGMLNDRMDLTSKGKSIQSLSREELVSAIIDAINISNEGEL